MTAAGLVSPLVSQTAVRTQSSGNGAAWTIVPAHSVHKMIAEFNELPMEGFLPMVYSERLAGEGKNLGQARGSLASCSDFQSSLAGSGGSWIPNCHPYPLLWCQCLAGRTCAWYMHGDTAARLFAALTIAWVSQWRYGACVPLRYMSKC
ncbi:hypothetical protein CEXT_539831 [Caerostris extrusa]|uniref:Uncharacterized protein n=1 Tax=Caerostris extrusa TaxID=172846 RepID=A0AAV4Q293_CAEEX|nr:hypothetical protein CEXT_539831 [Caerostris extrusa]